MEGLFNVELNPGPPTYNLERYLRLSALPTSSIIIILPDLIFANNIKAQKIVYALPIKTISIIVAIKCYIINA